MQVSLWVKLGTIGVWALVLLLLAGASIAGVGLLPRNIQLASNCWANAQGVECTFANTSQSLALGACVVGKLQRADGTGKPAQAVKSLPVCTGRIGPRETKNVMARWAEGRALDVCWKESELVGKQLDFDSCIFDTNELP